MRKNGNCRWCSPETFLPLAQVVGYSIGEVCASDSGGRGFNPGSRHNKGVKKVPVATVVSLTTCAGGTWHGMKQLYHKVS